MSLESRIEKAREDLRRLAAGGRAEAEARLRAESPTERCERCFGKGSYAEGADGKRRPYHPADFSPEADRYVASCPACRGFGYTPCTPARAAYIERRKEREERKRRKGAREEYARIRAAVCKDQDLETAHFDRLTRKKVPAGKESPEAWLSAARSVADFFGTELAA